MTPDYYIREATPDDAEQIIAHMKTIADEPNNGITYSSADEFTTTLEEEREILRQHQDAENSIWVVAVTHDERIFGVANATGGRRRVSYHTVGLGISIEKEWRGRGIGTAMIQFIIDWCRLNPVIHRLELGVYTNNPRAIHVYEKLGFINEGVRREAYFKEGRFVDAYNMAVLFDRI